MDVYAPYDGSLIATVERGGPRRLDTSAVMVNDHPAGRLDAVRRPEGVGPRSGGIPYGMEDMQIRKLLVIRSKEL